MSHLREEDAEVLANPVSGGRAEFKWEDVKSDQHRENYLGHSLMARTYPRSPISFFQF